MMKSLSSSQQIKYGAVLSYLGIVVYILVGLLYTPWMIRVIGKDDYGLYTLAYSIVALFVFDFGISAAIQRFIAKYLAEGRQDKADNCLGLVYRLYFIIDVVMFLILVGVFFFIPQIYKELTPDERCRNVIHMGPYVFAKLVEFFRESDYLHDTKHAIVEK